MKSHTTKVCTCDHTSFQQVLTNIRIGYGLGELSRFTARAGGLTLVNEFVNDDTFPSYKPQLLFGQVPRLRVKDKDGKVVFEVVQVCSSAQLIEYECLMG